jgi:hypothetical protein
VIFLEKLAIKKKRKRKSKPREKIAMLKCRVDDIKEEYLIMRPVKKGLLRIDETVTHTVKKSKIEKILKRKDEVVALNVHELRDGWRAKKILIPII